MFNRFVFLRFTVVFLAPFTSVADDIQAKPSPDRQPIGENFECTPLPKPFELDTQRTELEQVVFSWPSPDDRLRFA